MITRSQEVGTIGLAPMSRAGIVLFLAFYAISWTSAAGNGYAAEGRAKFAAKCAQCHRIEGPSPGSFNQLLKRKAPDLHYAGSKFKRSWLVAWLQNPSPIRPSGAMFLHHLAVENGKDQLKPNTIIPHRPRLTPGEARAMADFLMTLRDKRMKSGVVDASVKFSRVRALRLFRKQQPCVACHKIKSGKRIIGGVSGPDLTQAGARLDPDWIYARIENPQYWDPKTWMPRLEMSRKKRTLLTLFILSMK